MSPLQIRSRGDSTQRRWVSLGLLENPFPTSGVESSVYYSVYQDDRLEVVNRWLNSSLSKDATRWAPLVIKGSIGVGKTHILHQVEKAVWELDDPMVEVTRHTLTGGGARSLALSELLIEGLDSIEDRFEEREQMTLLDALFASPNASAAVAALPSSSPLRLPFRRIIDAKGQRRKQLSDLCLKWICRVPLSRGDYSSLDVSGKIDAEGQSVRAIAHFFRTLREAGVLDTWLIMIDQIEDLFRREATTPMKRARFLTDLRTLIDEALEGAPLPLILAWNTAISGVDVSEQLRQQYVALFSRLAEIVDLPALPREYALPFANAYLEAARAEYAVQNPEDGPRASVPYVVFKRALERDVQKVVDEVAESSGGVMPRRLLAALRQWADRYIERQAGRSTEQ